MNAAYVQAAPTSAKDLRLVPYPKEVRPADESFAVDVVLVVDAPDLPAVAEAAVELHDEIARVRRAECAIAKKPVTGLPGALLLYPPGGKPSNEVVRRLVESAPTQVEGYVLFVGRSFAAVAAREVPGLVRGVQTLRQLVRANLRDGKIPGLEILDWPSLKYRGFSDDITRGLSPTLDTLQREIGLAALLKMNFFTYYLEHQYAFATHPVLGPKDGSLKPEELRALVQYGKTRGVEIIGNQQSFGHFEHILKHEQYKALAETPGVLNPTNDDVYRFLDDLYSEQAPLIESPFFNVCCDETYGLGTGPSKTLADKIGVGGVYARHLRRIHDILKDKYGKRMMMWGDIILQHPEHLGEIPKDTVMLSWGYHAAPSFEQAILPFTKSGYDFFVCPGVNDFNRILPDFDVAVTNIRNYVRDGARHGAMGMLNTTWDDDGENLLGWKWHGLAWGAECAWNASATSIEDFNRRIGAVLFGEDGDHFGQAITLLGKAYHLPGFGGMTCAAFWTPESGQPASDEKTARRQAESLLAIVGPVIEHLKAAKASAKVNGDLLDYFLSGAQRMQLMATRRLAFLDAAGLYAKASQPDVAAATAAELLQKAIEQIGKTRDEFSRLKSEYVVLWNRENRPYALDRVTQRFDTAITGYQTILDKLDKAAKGLTAAQRLPRPADVGLYGIEQK